MFASNMGLHDGADVVLRALAHPLAAPMGYELSNRMKDRRVGLIDPCGHAAKFAALYSMSYEDFENVYVRDIEQVGKEHYHHEARPLEQLSRDAPQIVFIAAFDVKEFTAYLRSLLPNGTHIFSFDAMRLPRLPHLNYLDPDNWITAYSFFRETSSLHSRLSLFEEGEVLFCLMDHHGHLIHHWRESAPTRGESVITIDSRDLVKRMRQHVFTGQLLIHRTRQGSGHPIRFILDLFDDDFNMLSSSRASEWQPSVCYTGMPIPTEKEKLILWAQNPFPCEIKPKSLALGVVGSNIEIDLPDVVPPFGTVGIRVNHVLPGARPQQNLYLKAGGHLLQPRYEVVNGVGRRMNLMTPVRQHTESIIRLSDLAKIGAIIVAPILPNRDYRCEFLPVLTSSLGRPIGLSVAICNLRGEVVEQYEVQASPVEPGWFEIVPPDGVTQGHIEIRFDDDDPSDGSMEVILRYRHRISGAAAEITATMGLHNSLMTFSGLDIASEAPRTRLFLRLLPELDAFVHLIYAAPHRSEHRSRTTLRLIGRTETRDHHLSIPMGGSWYGRISTLFDEGLDADSPKYVMIEDNTCELVGYHGLVHGDAFSIEQLHRP